MLSKAGKDMVSSGFSYEQHLIIPLTTIWEKKSKETKQDKSKNSSTKESKDWSTMGSKGEEK